MRSLIDSFNNFSYNLQAENQQLVARARTYSQSFTNIFGSSVPASYIELGKLLRFVEERKLQIERSPGNR